jgi:hypothetical protein
METEIIEQTELALKRVPPGDKWIFANEKNSAVYPSLTDGLEAWYQNFGDTQFFIDARKGTVEIVIEQEVEKPVKRFSLYGEN